MQAYNGSRRIVPNFAQRVLLSVASDLGFISEPVGRDSARIMLDSGEWKTVRTTDDILGASLADCVDFAQVW